MEGRFAPPKAEHPFPNNPDMRKFWGPLSRAMHRSLAVVMAALLTVGGINMYLTRHEKGPFGLNMSAAPEKMKKRIEILNNSGLSKYPDMGTAMMSTLRQNHISFKNVDMTFDDDTVQFNIPVANPLPSRTYDD